MAEIPLYWGHGQEVVAVALVDDADVDLLGSHTWHRYRCTREKTEYVAARECIEPGRYRRLWMHRVILGLDDPRIIVDHKDHNGLDNRRSNLRVCTVALNSQNRIDDRGSSKFRGVYFEDGKWRARLFLKRDGNRSSVTAGSFDNELSAALAIDTLRKQIFPFAEPDPALLVHLKEVV